MKHIDKLWWIFAILGTIITLLNPYIGIFGFFNVTELFIMFCVNINIVCRVKIFMKHSEDKLLKEQIKTLGMMAYMLAGFFFIFKSSQLLVFLIAYREKNIAAPFQIWSNPDVMSVVCLIAEIILNVALLISFVCKGKNLRRMVKESE